MWQKLLLSFSLIDWNKYRTFIRSKWLRWGLSTIFNLLWCPQYGLVFRNKVLIQKISLKTEYYKFILQKHIWMHIICISTHIRKYEMIIMKLIPFSHVRSFSRLWVLWKLTEWQFEGCQFHMLCAYVMCHLVKNVTFFR